MRAVFFNILSVFFIPLALWKPFAGVLVYYWMAIMSPQTMVWAPFELPWGKLVAGATLLGLLLSSERKLPAFSWLLAFTVLFLVWTGLTTLTSHFPSLANERLTEFSKVVLMAVVAATVINSRLRIHALLWVLAISAGFWSVKMGIAVAATGGAWQANGPPQSPFFNSNGLARLCLMSMPIMFYLALQAHQSVVRNGMFLATLLTAAALVGTGSRGALIGLAGMLGYAWLRSSRKIAMAAGVLAVLLVGYIVVPGSFIERFSQHASGIANYEEVTTAQSRLAVWDVALDIANANPILGAGFGGVVGTHGHEAHSNYFQALGEQGYVGLALYLAICLGAFVSAWRVERMASEIGVRWIGDLALALQLVLVGYFVGGLTINHTYLELFYVYLAIIASLHHLAKQARSAVPEAPGIGARYRAAGSATTK